MLGIRKFGARETDIRVPLDFWLKKMDFGNNAFYCVKERSKLGERKLAGFYFPNFAEESTSV